MICRDVVGSFYTKGLIILCAVLQFSACGSGGGAGSVVGGSVSLNYTAPLNRADNSIQLPGEIDSYRIYYGSTSGIYKSEFNVKSDGSAKSTLTLNGLTIGATYFFVVTTIDTNGLESAYSPEISILI